jgi:hypothetical protein
LTSLTWLYCKQWGKKTVSGKQESAIFWCKPLCL